MLAGLVGGAVLVPLTPIGEPVVGAPLRYGREYGPLSTLLVGPFAVDLAFLGFGGLMYALGDGAFTTGALAARPTPIGRSPPASRP